MKIPAHVVPWLLLLVAIFVILAVLAWAGYDNWSDLTWP